MTMRDPHVTDDGSFREPNRVQIDILGDGLFAFSTWDGDTLISRETSHDLDWFLIATRLICEDTRHDGTDIEAFEDAGGLG